ncbi:MAG TPA: hypothetical protein PKW52_17265 [Nitrospira sp.]|nr:hypothetical protein [Nitrospira sp.]
MALCISFEDYVAQYGTITLDHDSGGTGSSTAVSGYTVASLKTRQLGDVFRFDRDGTGYTIIRVDFSTSFTEPLCIGVCGFTNVDTPSYTNPLTLRLYNTTTLLATSSYTDQTSEFVQTVVANMFASVVGCNRLEIWVSGTTDTIDIGRIWCGPAFQSRHSTGMSWDTGPVDTGSVSLSRSGAAYPRVGVVSREVTLPIPRLEGAEIFGTSYTGDIGDKSTVPLEYGVHSVGKTSEFLAFQENALNPMRPVYGHFIELPRFTSIGGNNYETVLNMREER